MDNRAAGRGIRAVQHQLTLRYHRRRPVIWADKLPAMTYKNVVSNMYLEKPNDLNKNDAVKMKKIL